MKKKPFILYYYNFELIKNESGGVLVGNNIFRRIIIF